MFCTSLLQQRFSYGVQLGSRAVLIISRCNMKYSDRWSILSAITKPTSPRRHDQMARSSTRVSLNIHNHPPSTNNSYATPGTTSTANVLMNLSLTCHRRHHRAFRCYVFLVSFPQMRPKSVGISLCNGRCSLTGSCRWGAMQEFLHLLFQLFC